MEKQQPLIDAFLNQTRIAVVGLSRSKLTPGNAITQKLHGAGYSVFPVHPEMETFEGIPCHTSLSSIGEPLDGVMLATRPEVTEQLVDECIALGVPRIWMHNRLGTCTRIGKGTAAQETSVSEAGTAKAREAGIEVITGSCPMQFVAPLDRMHRCLSWFNRVTGNTR